METGNNLITKLANAKFKFASTMPLTPHEYTLRKDWDSNEFDKVVVYIRENGVQERFENRDYTYFYHDDWKYWTMGAPLAETILINRAKAI